MSENPQSTRSWRATFEQVALEGEGTEQVDTAIKAEYTSSNSRSFGPILIARLSVSFGRSFVLR
jgi:hypothetical protein